jgi:hypothetical protein
VEREGYMEYREFLLKKADYGSDRGFDPVVMPDSLYDFQKWLVTWAVKKGRCAIFADCGLGKTLMQLAWSQNIVEFTNKPVLILTPLAVGHQTIKEACKFGFNASRSKCGAVNGAEITVTNYERLTLFDPAMFSGVVCDESSILKNFDGKRKSQITEFMRTVPYRLLCTATAAPNDWDELGTSSEALGYLGYQDMLSMFFRQQTNKDHLGWGRTKFVLRSHAHESFWRWVCSWCRPIRKPSDYGFDDSLFTLPGMSIDQHLIEQNIPRKGMLFATPAVTLQEQREERRNTIEARCARVAELVEGHDRSVMWCDLNDEGDCLEHIDGAVQVSGKDCDEEKEEKLVAFQDGVIKRLVTKPKIAGFGMNWQHCAHMTSFPSHSFEQHYQCVRRLLRFGQKREVKVDIVTSPGEASVLSNLQRKSSQADVMFDSLLRHVHHALQISPDITFDNKIEVPSWM